MAKEVFNYLLITGENALIQQLKKAAKYDQEKADWIVYMNYENANNSLFCLACLFPESQALRHKERMYYENKEYKFKPMSDAANWRIQHWGTDADIFDVEEKIDQSELWKIRFISRFAPPLLAIQKISTDYCGLTFKLGYWTPDSDFQGDAIFKDGDCILDEREIWVPESNEHINILESDVDPFVKGCLQNTSDYVRACCIDYNIIN